jgi:16S rRNA (cytosine967-C5)-methyltransferase
MTPSARLQSAIELLDLIILSARDGGAAADHIARQFFGGRRYAGSKDRRAVRDLVWQAIRVYGDRPVDGRSAMLGLAAQDGAMLSLFDGSAYGPATVQPGEARARVSVVPKWLKGHFAEPVTPEETQALLGRASLDVRVNSLKAERQALLQEFPEAEALALPDAFRLPIDFRLDDHAAYKEGRLEVQDYGSQLIVAACEAVPGMTVLDLCAGAGGKTLALASAMQGKGQLIATDTNRNRLDQLPPRAARAGAQFIEARLLDPGKEREKLEDLKGKCDIVLVDAPCSGTGTWRRNPETRWRLTPARLKRVVDEQANLLRIAAEMVAPGGKLVYAVCSVLEAEGRGQVDAFLEQQAGWKAERIALPAGRAHGAGILLTPLHDGSDGFFFARLKKL